MTAVQQQNFQPQVPDSTHGAINHTYIPRADGSLMIGGIAYYPQVSSPAVTPVPVVTPAPVPVAVTPAPAPQQIYPPVQQPAIAVAPQVAYQPAPQISYQPASQVAYPLAAHGQAYPMQYMPYQQPTPPIAQYHQFPTPMPGGFPQPHFGQTGGEVLGGQMAYANAEESKMNKPQDMKPEDDDPHRMYWCRETDNTWTQRNRMTLDSGDIGDIRWYALGGQFYAVRLGDA